MKIEPPTPITPAAPESIAYPLDEFYSRSGLLMPPLETVDGAAVPEPYRSLLVHERDMTSTLENFHKKGIHLSLISRQQRGEAYFREVLLVLDDRETPVEFGAIRINLAGFSAPARAAILEERYPLGHILKQFGIGYVSRPKAFLRVASDKIISLLLGLHGTHRLYGRRNSLLDSGGNSLAEIVEILPPAPSVGSTSRKAV